MNARLHQLLSEGLTPNAERLGQVLDAAEGELPIVRHAVHLAVASLVRAADDPRPLEPLLDRLDRDINVEDTVQRLGMLVSDPAATVSDVTGAGMLLDLVSSAPGSPVRPDGSADLGETARLLARANRGDPAAHARLRGGVFSRRRDYAPAFKNLRTEAPILADQLEPFRPPERAVFRRVRQSLRSIQRGEPAAVLACASGSTATLLSLVVLYAVTAPASAPAAHAEAATTSAAVVHKAAPFSEIDRAALGKKLTGRAIIVLRGPGSLELEQFFSEVATDGAIVIAPQTAERAFKQALPPGISFLSWMTQADGDRILSSLGIDPAAHPVAVAQTETSGGTLVLRVTSLRECHQILTTVISGVDATPVAPPTVKDLLADLDEAVRTKAVDLDTGMVRIRQALAVARTPLENFRIHDAAWSLWTAFAGAQGEAEASHVLRLAVHYGEEAQAVMTRDEVERLGRLKEQATAGATTTARAGK